MNSFYSLSTNGQPEIHVELSASVMYRCSFPHSAGAAQGMNSSDLSAEGDITKRLEPAWCIAEASDHGA